MKIAVIGAGWAGLAAAVKATACGHAVTLFEAAPIAGGRARSDTDAADALDNGQHVMLGGYERTLALMRAVGVDVGACTERRPLELRWVDGTRLALPPGHHGTRGLATALLGARGFSLRDRLSIAAIAARWRRAGFTCSPDLTVERLLASATPRARERLWAPLCLAALNTPVAEADAATFLAVLRDSVFGAPGASDLVLPSAPLSRLLPAPALAWLQARGAVILMRRRVGALTREGAHWIVHPTGDPGASRHDGVILATSSNEAARLTAAIAPAWSATASALRHEPIVSITLRAAAQGESIALLALPHDDHAWPAQFALCRPDTEAGMQRVTLVVSAAARWLERGLDAVTQAAQAQLTRDFGCEAALVDARADRRATFRCVPGLRRPPRVVADRLHAAGDYVAGPYPATLEAAVRAGEDAVFEGPDGMPPG